MEITIIYEDAFGKRGIKELANVIDYKLNCTELGYHSIEIEFEHQIVEYVYHRIIKVNEH